MKSDLLTIHEVRKDLEKALELSCDLNKEYLDNGTINTYNLRSVYEYLEKISRAKWTNETF